MRRIPWLVLVLAGCDGGEIQIKESGVKDTGPVESQPDDSGGDSGDSGDSGDTGVPADADGDGFAQVDGDCDDGDAAVNPGAAEVCDGIDNDCSGAADDGAIDAGEWYADLDGDGWGGGATQAACSAPLGYVALSGDCDDGEAAIHPEAVEYCDGIDNDCDGVADEPEDMPVWYADTDGDGYGDDGRFVLGCEAPGGYIGAGGDCDDSSALIYPGAAEIDCADPTDYNCDGLSGAADGDGDGFAACEECDDADAAINPGAAEVCDGIDNDCSGVVDGSDAVGARFWYADGDVDGYGDVAQEVAGCDQPPGYVNDATDCDDADGAIHPGAAEYCDGIDQDCDGRIDNDPVDGTIWYMDGDGDGWGLDSAVQTACDQPPGYEAAGGDCEDADSAIHPGAAETDCADPTDYNCDGFSGAADNDGDGFGACRECDDSDAAAYPGAAEYCDGEDDDCDGVIDEDTAVDALSWYLDSDSDGYGDSAVAAIACAAPGGYVGNSGDCDDAEPLAWTGAAEVCDGVDNDCDGTADVGAVDAPGWYTDGDGDGWGAGAAVRVCAQPGGSVAAGGDCDDSDAAVSPSALEYCNGYDDDCDGTTDEDSAVDAPGWYVDSDGDGWGDPATMRAACSQPAGYGAAGGDCDDGDAAVSPGAAEICDGIDNDCSGGIDDGATDAGSWYTDTDGDGYGDPATALVSCAQPAGTVGAGGDCNDRDAVVNPGEDEVCDGIDNDCDGSADEPSAIDAGIWYADADGDGYGDAAALSQGCTQPAGYVLDATDCDDARADVNPGGAEVCDALDADEDCDGLAEDADRSATGQLSWYGDRDGDNYGAGAAVLACDAGSGYALLSTDCDDAAATVNPGATEICDGIDQDCDGVIDDGAGGGTWYLDADGDGYGVSTSTRTDCRQPAGYAAAAGDCDDGDSGVSPGASEYCDGVDGDCDGVVDDSAVDMAAYYIDADRDGFGDASARPVYACSAPAGYRLDGRDCSDADAGIRPYAYDAAGGADTDCGGTAGQDGAISAGSGPIGGSDYVRVEPVGMTFPLCGTSHSRIYMITEGRLTFNNNDTDSTESMSDLASDTAIMAYWDDLTVPNNGTEWVEFDGAITFTWIDAYERFGLSYDELETSITLFEDGRILIYTGNYDVSVLTRDAIAGWSCSPGSTPSELNLSSAMDTLAATAGTWGYGSGTETAQAEVFYGWAFGDSYDLAGVPVRLCGNPGTGTSACPE